MYINLPNIDLVAIVLAIVLEQLGTRVVERPFSLVAKHVYGWFEAKIGENYVTKFVDLKIPKIQIINYILYL